LRAALFDHIKNMTIIEKDIPEIGENEVLIQLITAGICGSEVHAYVGTHPFRTPPSILGHEVIGNIVLVGDKVTTLNVGDMVTVEPHVGCSHCSQCLAGRYNLCKEKVVLGTQKWDGGFAEYMTAPEQAVYIIPKTISPHLAVLTEPLAVGVHAVNIADVKKGDKVAILGSGPIGLVTAVAAHYKGADTICLTDAIDSNLEIGKRLCATDVVNVREQSLQNYVSANICEFDHVFITFGHKSVIEDAFNVIKRKGKIISIALFEEKVPIDLNKVMISEVQMFGSSMYVMEDFKMAIDIIASQKYNLESLVTHSYPFEQISEAMETALTKSGSPIKIVVDLP
jgi:L-iditol 2-dehydrogenase